ncbi:hypothetical protein Clacol_010509 [Clathrus columnatus]|uniref:Uncharacterized protein n=1 Tax=Clathrus columnatus TaxID=1419009 RepID=A0AAV5AU94_9AGAM|nr:hypothetical protein Clacol_010509 [Clathrus columnatus]
MNKHKLRSAHKPQITVQEMIQQIIAITDNADPLNEWGIRRIQEELRMISVHIPRNVPENQKSGRGTATLVRTQENCSKNPFSAGPNEEWCMDGHEKLREAMGIDIWGVCDKYSRYELGLWAVPNARRSEVPVGELGRWLWAKVVQARLNHVREQQIFHRVRLQRKVLLPTGGTPHDFYTNPEKFRGTNLLIKIQDMTMVDLLLEEHSSERFLQFGDEKSVPLFEELYTRVGKPELRLRDTWNVWRSMMDLVQPLI